MIIKTFVIRNTSFLYKYGFAQADDKGGTYCMSDVEQKIQKIITNFLNSKPNLTEYRRETSVSVATDPQYDAADFTKVVAEYIVTCYFDKKEKVDENDVL